MVAFLLLLPVQEGTDKSCLHADKSCCARGSPAAAFPGFAARVCGLSWHIPWRELEFKHWCLLLLVKLDGNPSQNQPSPPSVPSPQPPPQDNPAPSPGLSPARTHSPLPVSPLTAGQPSWGSRAGPAGKRDPFPPHSFSLLTGRMRHLLGSHQSSSRGWSQGSSPGLWGQGRACPAAAVGLLCPVPSVLFPLGIQCATGTPGHLPGACSY